MGRAVSIEEFARVCLELERRGAANANIVTGSHAIPAIAAGLRRAREKGFTLPVVWNSSAYETVEALMLLDNGDPETRLVDIWLPDLKTQDGGLSRRYFAAPDYPAKAAAAILFMLERTPLVWEGTPCASALKQGVIIRHLALPGMLAETRGALKWFAENARGRALLSLMTQYTPVIRHETKDGSGPAPQRYLDEAENTALLALLDEFGIDDGYVQDLAPDDGWLPDFNRTNPFSPALSVPVWHWKTGFVPAPSPQGNVKKQQ
jgi:putative pyruvate formate lyase activating enzyme